eukprot:scaffold3275_cov183-Ochromonas_danica.AAC.1
MKWGVLHVQQERCLHNIRIRQHRCLPLLLSSSAAVRFLVRRSKSSQTTTLDSSDKHLPSALNCSYDDGNIAILHVVVLALVVFLANNMLSQFNYLDRQP